MRGGFGPLDMFLPLFNATFLLMDITVEITEALDTFVGSLQVITEAVADLCDIAFDDGREQGYEQGYRDAVATFEVGDPAEAEDEPDTCGDPTCPFCGEEEFAPELDDEDEFCPCTDCQIDRLEGNQTADAVVIEALLDRVAAVEDRLTDVEEDLLF